MTILFVSLSWHPFLLRRRCLLSSYHSWHAPSGSNSALPIWVMCHPNRTLPPKEPWQESQNRFSLLPTTKPCPLTSDPWPHCVLYWLGTGWWGLGLARAFLPYVSKICLPLSRPPWSGGLLAQSAVRFLTFYVSCFLISHQGAGPLLLLGFTFLSAHFLIALISCHVTLSFLL